MIRTPLRGLELQFRTRSKVTTTSEGKALMFGFAIGPLHLFCIANMPELTGEYALKPLVYIKLSLAPDSHDGDWEIFKDHG